MLEHNKAKAKPAPKSVAGAGHVVTPGPTAPTPAAPHDASAVACARITEYEHVEDMLCPIRGCFDDNHNPLVSIDDAIAKQPDDLVDFLWAAKKFARKASTKAEMAKVAGMTACMVAAVWMFTAESPLYRNLNAALRAADRSTLMSSYFPYLRLLITAIRKLEAMGGGELRIVNRGVKRDLVKEFPDDYAKDETMIWWPITSTTSNAEALKQPMFLGDQGDRTLFQIQTRKAVDISMFSAIKAEAELVLCCATALRFTAILPLGNGLTMITCEDDEDAPSMLS